jgi:hypothetical protein
MKKIAIAICVTVAGIAAAYFTQEAGQTLVFQTVPVPVLAPHEHDTHEDTVSDDGHGIEVYSKVFTPKQDLWITGIDYENVNAPGNTLHHAMLAVASSTWAWCSEKPDERFFIILTEDQMHDPRVRFPKGYAVRVPARTPIVLYAMFHNPEPPLGSGDTYRDVSGKITLHLAESSAEEPLKPLTYYSPRLADNPCAPKDFGYVFDIPPSVSDYHVTGEDAPVHTERVTFERPVTIKFWGAHVHGWQGGKALVVKKNGDVLRTFETRRLDTDGYAFETPQEATDIRFEAEDTLTLEAVYDNPTDKAVVGAMGILYMYVHEE